MDGHRPGGRRSSSTSIFSPRAFSSLSTSSSLILLANFFFANLFHSRSGLIFLLSVAIFYGLPVGMLLNSGGKKQR
jgi:hypothetical protein